MATALLAALAVVGALLSALPWWAAPILAGLAALLWGIRGKLVRRPHYRAAEAKFREIEIEMPSIVLVLDRIPA